MGVIVSFSASKWLTKPIHGYQKLISPMKTMPTCRFVPSCSTYAIEAIESRGALRGSGMAIWRLLRCHPFSRGGYDPVVLHCGSRNLETITSGVEDKE